MTGMDFSSAFDLQERQLQLHHVGNIQHNHGPFQYLVPWSLATVIRYQFIFNQTVPPTGFEARND
jgi:hypothetical protein